MTKSISTLRNLYNDSQFLSGSNDMPVKNVYSSRIEYDKKHAKREGSINLISEKTIYGRIDMEQNYIYPNIELLVPLLASKRETGVFVLPFVADAYTAMESEILTAISNNKLKASSLFPFSVKKDYSNPLIAYSKQFDSLLEAYKSYILENSLLNQFENFNQFLNLFNKFLLGVNYGVSLSDFIMKSSINIAGISIVLKESDFATDLKKEQFYAQSDFSNYTYILKKYGFKYDYHAPWRIIFDYNTPFATSYLAKYEIQKTSDIFDIFYQRAVDTELSIMIEKLVNYYNIMCNTYAYIYKHKTMIENGKYITKTEKKLRLFTTEEEVLNSIPLHKLMKFYLFIRLKEVNKTYSQQQFDDLATTLEYIIQTQGKEAGYNFVLSNTITINAQGGNPKISLTTPTLSGINTLDIKVNF